jgi:fluoroacetyl-CoA thioesterase
VTVNESHETRLREGITGKVSVRVTAEMTAAHYGNGGVEVLATPYLIGLLESAAGTSVKDALAPGEGTVGTRVEVQHLAATPVGMTVTARSRLKLVEGRRLLFDVEAHDDVEMIAQGIHERFVVDLSRFLARVEKKRAAAE